MPHSSSENVSVNRLCSLTSGAAANAPPETTSVSARAPARTRASLRMVTPSGIEDVPWVGEVVAHRPAADRVGCAMVSDRGGDGVAFKRLGIRVHVGQSGQGFTAHHELALLGPTHSKTPRPKLAVLLAERRTAPATAGLDEDLSPLAPPARPPGPAKQLSAGNSNDQGGRGQDTNYGHLATYSARVPTHLPPQPPEDSPAADESAEIGDGGQNAVDPHSVRLPVTHGRLVEVLIGAS